MNLDGLRDTVRDWQGESDAGARAIHLTTIRALLTRAPVINDPLDAALASVDPDAPDLVNTLRAAIEPVRATARAVAEIHDPLPDPLLSLAGKGALLSVGEVCMLSGEGGIAKSALAVGLAVDVANANAADGAVSGAGPLRWHGGPASTLLVCYVTRRMWPGARGAMPSGKRAVDCDRPGGGSVRGRTQQRLGRT